MKSFTHDGAKSNWKLEQSWNNTGSCKNDLSVLEHESTPAFTNYHKVWVLHPKFLAHLDKEWIGIRLHIVGVPVSMILIPEYHFTIHEVFCRIGRLVIHIQP